MINKVTLANGVRVVTEEIPGVRSVAIGLWVKVGSRDEHCEVNGVSHFIEHLMFKGTTNRTAKQLAEALDAVGGQLNAFTSKEYTCYYARVLDEHRDLALNVLSDMFFNSSFLARDIDRERNVVLEEIKMYEDDPDDLVHDVFVQTLFADHPLGKSIIGTSDIIANISREQILAFKDKYYNPANLVVAIAGNFKTQQVLQELEAIFGNWSGSTSTRESKPTGTQNSITTRHKDIEQVHFCLGKLGLKQDHPDIYVLHCLNSVLGGGLSSRLFQSIREERGLVYSVYSYLNTYSDTGIFGVYGALSPKNFEEVIGLIKQEFKLIQQEGITGEELTRAKEQLKGNLFLGLESVSSRMSRLGKSECTLNRLVSTDEIVKRINDVSLEDIKRMAEQVLAWENTTVAVIGPNYTEAGISSILGG